MSLLNLVHLYPQTLGLNGDVGNLIAVSKLLELHGAANRIVDVELGQKLPSKIDFVLIGHGSLSAAEQAATDLQRHLKALKAAAAKGTQILGIGTGWDLLATKFVTPNGTFEAGLLPTENTVTKTYVVGEIVAETTKDVVAVAGFVNSNRKIKYLQGSKPWMKVLATEDSMQGFDFDGVIQGSVIGSNLAGPLLAMNPQLINLNALGVSAKPTASNKQELDRILEFARLSREAIAKRLNYKF